MTAEEAVRSIAEQNTLWSYGAIMALKEHNIEEAINLFCIETKEQFDEGASHQRRLVKNYGSEAIEAVISHAKSLVC